MKHIIICGSRGVGKSTLIRKLIGKTGFPISGFITKKSESAGDGTSSIYIYPASESTQLYRKSEQNLIGKCNNRRMLEAHPEVFDSIGCLLLSKIDERGIIIMDELGFLESEAFSFQRRVLELLDGDTLVIAAIKNKNISFLNRIRSHRKCDVYKINEENRDQLFEKLSLVLNDEAATLLRFDEDRLPFLSAYEDWRQG